MKRTPSVNEVNEFLEIASDFEDPLELLRESLSNAFDAGAESVDIRIRTQPNGSDIIIEDDGHGMDEEDLKSFFDLGNSNKTDSIGYKGHGTKIFYKSDHIKVNTSKDGTTLSAEMEQPWEKLNNRVLPEYDVTKTDSPSSRSGTLIRISGFKSGEGFSPESLTYPKVHNYLKWKTIVGSTAHFFVDDFHEMDVTVELDDEIDDSREQLTTTNKFEFPSEQLLPGDGQFPAERMCKLYGPKEISLDHAEGTSTVEIVGMAGGKAARNELPTFGRHSTQFGVWLAKDHIKIERLNEAISHDNEFIHFLFVANCQDIELSANRGKIRNKSSSVYQALEEELSHFLSKVTHDPWFEGYLDARRQGELARKASSESDKASDRVDRIQSREQFAPSNDAEILFGLQRPSAQSNAPEVLVEDYHPTDNITAIVRNDGTLQAAAVGSTLVEYFEDEAPLEPAELLICWEWGDTDELREIQRTGYLGNKVNIDSEQHKITYETRDGKSGFCDVIIVSDYLETPIVEEAGAASTTPTR
jgi:hypothetical protein